MLTQKTKEVLTSILNQKIKSNHDIIEHNQRQLLKTKDATAIKYHEDVIEQTEKRLDELEPALKELSQSMLEAK